MLSILHLIQWIFQYCEQKGSDRLVHYIEVYMHRMFHIHFLTLAVIQCHAIMHKFKKNPLNVPSLWNVSKLLRNSIHTLFWIIQLENFTDFFFHFISFFSSFYFLTFIKNKPWIWKCDWSELLFVYVTLPTFLVVCLWKKNIILPWFAT